MTAATSSADSDMFLTTLLSDAAAQHGHEFSAPRPTTPARISPIPRMMRPQSSLARARHSLPPRFDGNTTSPDPLAAAAAAAAAAVTATRAEKVMFKEEAEVKIVQAHRRSMSESSEEETPIMAALKGSAGDPAQGAAAEAAAAALGRKSKKDARVKTSYTFAHAAGRTHAFHKLRSRPAAVLQLQQVTPGARPKPAFEVFPSGRYAKKLGRELARLHKGKDKLGAEDVVVCKAHEYDGTEDEWDSQEVIGIVCASCKDESHASGNAQLCLEDGSAWEAIAHARGRYDFVSTDRLGHRRVIRWVPRRVQGRQRPRAASVPTGGMPAGASSPSEEVVYRFSTIDPSSRRHPVIATMTSATLEINDTYFMPTASADQEESEAPAVQPASADREALETTALLRSLILLSGVYVALRNNWSPVFSYKRDAGKTAEGVKPPSRSNSVRSANNASPAPSTDGLPTAPSRRHTFNFSRSNSTVSQTPGGGGSMTQALNGSFSDASATSRSTTPESRHRRGDSLWSGLMRSATASFPATNGTAGSDGRNPSNATVNTESTFAEGSEYSRQSERGSLVSTPRTPTPSSRPGDSTATPPSGDYFVGARRTTTMPNAFAQRTSSLRKHWRVPSGSSTVKMSLADAEPVAAQVDDSATTTAASVSPDTTATTTLTTSTSTVPPESVASPAVRVGRFSFGGGRGRTADRAEKSLSVIEGRSPPLAFNNHLHHHHNNNHHNSSNNNNQWWIDWGSTRSPSRPAAALEGGDAAKDGLLAPPGDNDHERRQADLSPSRPVTAIRPHRRSFSIQSWRRKEGAERPRSMLVVPGEAVGAPQQQQQAPQRPTEESNKGGSLFRRVTHRLRREERRLG